MRSVAFSCVSPYPHICGCVASLSGKPESVRPHSQESGSLKKHLLILTCSRSICLPQHVTCVLFLLVARWPSNES